MIPFNETTMKILPPDIQTKLQDQVLFEKQNLLNIIINEKGKNYFKKN